MNAKFSTTIFFMTRKVSYGAASVFKKLDDRTIPFKHLIPDHTLLDPKFSQNFLDYQYTRRMFKTPDDEGNQANDGEEEDQTEDPFENNFFKDKSQLGPTEPSWKDLYQQNFNKSGTEDDPEDFSSPFSTDFVTQVEQEQENLVKRSTSKKYIRKSHSISINRPKRQAFMSLVFGVLASVGVLLFQNVFLFRKVFLFQNVFLFQKVFPFQKLFLFQKMFLFQKLCLF